MFKRTENGIEKIQNPQVPPPTLEENLFTVDEMAGAFRATIITTVEGQEATYLQKVAAAEKYVSDPSSVAVGSADYNYLNASVIDGSAPDVASAAQLILATSAQWNQLNSGIEIKRLKAKSDLRAAPNADARKAIIDALDYSSLLQV